MRQMEELRSLIGRHCVERRVVSPIPRVTLLKSHCTTPPASVLYEPVFCIIAQGAKRIVVGDKVLVYDKAKYLIVSVDLPACGEIVTARSDEPYLAVSVALDRATLAQMLLELGDGAPAGVPEAGMAVSEVTEELLDPVIRLLRLIDAPEDIPMLAPLAERELLYRLLRGGQGAMLRQIALADSRLSRISRAIDWIRIHYAEALRIEMLAEVAGMSAATFHRHFKAVTSMSPLQFQKQVRLQEARRLLLFHRGDAGAIGFRVGYESPSQFSREYGRLFGAPPARDAARLREITAGDPARLGPPV